MKKLITSILAVTLFTTIVDIAPSLAAEDWPAAPTPSWYASSGISGLRVAQWLPCREEWKSTNDCIQSLQWRKLDGSSTGFATFVPNPNFDPMTAVQVWEGATDLSGNRIDNYGHFLNVRAGYWELPQGFSNSDGSKNIYVEAHLMAGGLQFRVTADDASNLPIDSSATITLKSKNYGSYAGWIFGNTKSPLVSIGDGTVTISGNPVMTPYAAGPDPDICHSNTKKASGSESVIQISLSLKNPAEQISAGDAILGTNGNGCFSGVSFDPVSQQIIVGIGNSHFDENGKPIDGWFNLMIKGSRAKQWWGINSANVANSVQVQVVYEDGTSVIASTQAKYDSKLDIITLQSQGFHFSSPVLRVGLKKSSPATITCVKGKTTKKVTAIKPICPKGYLKK